MLLPSSFEGWSIISINIPDDILLFTRSHIIYDNALLMVLMVINVVSMAYFLYFLLLVLVMMMMRHGRT
jgi:hypothetical protein